MWPLPDDTMIVGLQDDFIGLATGLYTVSGVGTPAVAIATTGTYLNGRLGIVTTASANDTSIVQTVSNAFAVNPPVPAFFDAVFQFDDATNAGLRIGLVKGTSPFASTKPSGIYLVKDGTNTVYACVSNGTNSTLVSLGTVVAATDYRLTIYFDGGKLANEVGGLPSVGFQFGPVSATGVANQYPGVRVAGTYLPAATDGLYATLACKAMTAAARTLNVDYMVAGCGRS
jgi:hypothetical protein